MSALQVEVLTSLSRHIAAGTDEFAFGGYRLTRARADSTSSRVILSFTSTYAHPEGGGSHPEEEAENVLRLLSLFCNVRHRREGMQLNGVEIPQNPSGHGYSHSAGDLETEHVPADLARFQMLDDDLARQFLRASHTYAFALEFVPSEPTFAFLLLVIAIECLSSQDAVLPFARLDPARQKTERFVAFIESHISDADRGADERDPALMRELLKTVYYSHRSGFVHGGSEVSAAALLADRLGSSYFKHELAGREVKTPGIGWFAHVVRNALLGFLRVPTRDERIADQEILGRLAYEKAALRLKAKRAIEAHRIVTADDIEYR